MKRNKCKQCGWKWGVSACVDEEDYLCPRCRRQLSRLTKRQSKHQIKRGGK